MALHEDLEAEVDAILTAAWNTRTGRKVPSTGDVALAGGAVEVEATFLYADLANSSLIAKSFDRRIAAKILKSFLATTARLVKHHGGSVVSFDGDRILGVFVGDDRNTVGPKCALQIKYVVEKIIRPKLEAKYEVVRTASFKIGHGVGMDSGVVLAVKAGIRGDNDLIWIGRPANLAAKLSDRRDHSTHLTAAVYNAMEDSSRYGGSERHNMWTKEIWRFLGEDIVVYHSDWRWKP